MNFTLNGVNFSAQAVLKRTEAEFVKEYKEKFKGTNFFGKRDDAKQEVLLKEAYKMASDMVPKKEEPKIKDK